MEYILLFFSELILLFFLSQHLTRTLASIIIAITKNQNITVWILSLLFFPGVLIHELSHLLMASVLFVKVGAVEFVPHIRGDGTVKLGSVEVARTDPFRRALIGIAPIGIGLSLIFSSLFYFTTPSLSGIIEVWKIIVLLYILFEISNTMFASKKDLEGTLEVAAAMCVIGGFFYFFGGSSVVSSFIHTFLLSSKIVSLFQIGSMYVLVPIGIDAVLLIVARGFKTIGNW